VDLIRNQALKLEIIDGEPNRTVGLDPKNLIEGYAPKEVTYHDRLLVGAG